MEKNRYNLFLDDIRNPDVCTAYTKNPIYDEVDWVIVRSYDEFVECVTKNGLPKIVSFDHDLADEHYAPQHWWDNYNEWAETQNFQEKTGYDCVKWMVDYCLDNRENFPIWYLHTMNPIGAENMKVLILNYLKHFEQK